jgi:hypothetical protein
MAVRIRRCWFPRESGWAQFFVPGEKPKVGHDGEAGGRSIRLSSLSPTPPDIQCVAEAGYSTKKSAVRLRSLGTEIRGRLSFVVFQLGFSFSNGGSRRDELGFEVFQRQPRTEFPWAWNRTRRVGCGAPSTPDPVTSRTESTKPHGPLRCPSLARAMGGDPYVRSNARPLAWWGRPTTAPRG